MKDDLPWPAYQDENVIASSGPQYRLVPEPEARELWEMKKRIEDINTGDPDIVKFYMSLTNEQDEENVKLRKALEYYDFKKSWDLNNDQWIFAYPPEAEAYGEGPWRIAQEALKNET